MAPSANDQIVSPVASINSNGNENGNGKGTSKNDDKPHPLPASIIAPLANINHALPGLSTLASVASTSTPHLRYVILHDVYYSSTSGISEGPVYPACCVHLLKEDYKIC
jgi:hypothetical protein